MIVNRLIWKSWLCMFFAIRFLTLIAFTAHAMLGCCLSHGSCMQEHAAMLTGHCGDHSINVRNVHENCESHSRDVSDKVSENHPASDCQILAFAGLPIDGHGHSHHGDDARCIFGFSSGTSTAAAWQWWADASWINTSVDFRQMPCLHGGLVRIWLDGLPQADHNRAVHQVWLI